MHEVSYDTNKKKMHPLVFKINICKAKCLRSTPQLQLQVPGNSDPDMKPCRSAKNTERFNNKETGAFL